MATNVALGHREAMSTTHLADEVRVQAQALIPLKEEPTKLTSKTRSNVENLSVSFRQELVQQRFESLGEGATRSVVVLDGSYQVPEILYLQMFFTDRVEAWKEDRRTRIEGGHGEIQLRSHSTLRIFFLSSLSFVYDCDLKEPGFEVEREIRIGHMRERGTGGEEGEGRERSSAHLGIECPPSLCTRVTTSTV